jgi:hypothetical protein
MDGCIEVQRVVGFGQTQLVVTKNIFFWRNGKTVPVAELTQTRKTVFIDTCKVLFDKVLLTGRLRKDIMFREINDCIGKIVGYGEIVDDVPFTAEIEVKGARPEDSCIVVKAFAEGEVEEPIRAKTGGFKGVIDTTVLFFCVKVVRDTLVDDCDDWEGSEHDQSHTHTHTKKHFRSRSHSHSHSHVGSRTDDGLSDEIGCVREYGASCSSSGDHSKGKGRRPRGCPDRKTTGLVVGGGKGVPDAQPGRVPGTWIGPTVLFAGGFVLGQ